jgi:hypothetical protein
LLSYYCLEIWGKYSVAAFEEVSENCGLSFIGFVETSSMKGKEVSKRRRKRPFHSEYPRE